MSPDDGYGVWTGYTYGYYRQLSPSWLRLVATINSVAYPEDKPFRYFELGYGQGVSINIHAAANDGDFWGNDYNPKHVEFARRTAEASGAPVRLLDDHFEALASRDDLPQFHVIVAHGVWSWISERSRDAILRFVDRNLARGGLLYLSYNALPGSASGIALQRLLRILSLSMDQALSETERFNRARDSLRKMAAAPDGHFASYPKAQERLARLLESRSPYFLHEYSVGSWEPSTLADVAAALRPIGLSFAGSVRSLDEALHAEHRPASEPFEAASANGLEGKVLAQTLRDFRVDRQFRSDLFVRGRSRISHEDRTGPLRRQRFALTAHPDDVELGASDTETTEISSIRSQVLTQFAERSRGVAAAGDVLNDLNTRDPHAVMQAILQCADAGALHPVCNDPSDGIAERTLKLNNFFATDLVAKDKVQVTASPIAGAGFASFVPIPAFEAAIAAGAEISQEHIVEAAHSLQGAQKACYSALDLLRQAARYEARRLISINLGL